QELGQEAQEEEEEFVSEKSLRAREFIDPR
ncbi:hypothetical protein A2U01_0091512, partial [Trifolium medium]|nr:hypothetical protein [Trifolium medium]